MSAAATSLPPEKRQKKTPSTFLGRAVNKLDIDELQVDEEVIKAARGSSKDSNSSLAKLTALNLAIPTAQKSLRPEDQHVRDEQGRRRFHGAFTGGFSAGYYNTVGTAEGWTPATFKSSRLSKQTRESRVEDFMDDEDLEIMTSFTKKHLTVIPSKHFRNKYDQKSDDAEFEKLFSSHSQVNDLSSSKPNDNHSLFLSNLKLQDEMSRHAGFHILKSLGWRESKSIIFGPVARRCPRELGQRKIGPQAYPSTMKNHNKSESEERLDQEEEVLKQSNWINKSLSVLKKNLEGIGYLSMSLRDLANISSDDEESFTATTSYKNDKKKIFQEIYDKKNLRSSKTIRGEAFGVGVFDEDGDDWDQIYDDEVISSAKRNYSLCEVKNKIEELKAMSNKPFLIYDEESKTQQSASLKEAEFFHDPSRTFVFVIGKEFAAKTDINSCYIASTPSQIWDGRHRMTAAEELAENTLRTQETTKAIFSELLEFLQRYRTPVTPIKQLASYEEAQVSKDFESPQPIPESKEVSTKSQKQFLLSTETKQQPLWNKIDDKAKQALLSSLNGSSKFVMPLNDEKASVVKPGSSLNCYFPDNIEQQKRYELFCLALEEKIPASLVFDTSKDSLTNQEERRLFGDYYRAFRVTHPNIDLYTCCSTVTQKFVNTLGQKKLEQTRTRISYNFKPEPRVCRCFGVPYPWDRKEFVDDFPECLRNSSGVNSEIASKSRSNTFISTVISVLGPQVPTKQEEVKVMESEEDDTWIAPRPPKSTFEAVFGIDEESDNI